ncbi:hypothetical protein G9C85_13045 [Halorubellus sp. JP-L1]|uniref:hypothetical protein n=1 Tax=Halorubellus sp. JP-L1 TaxID=2715753 RepID=UPI00140A2190|nr:hypothetical protein [Halorubellus sp. JP-L1]NHN42547.1 hypothetical protein [Halorubellus sp. JP-L1]
MDALPTNEETAGTSRARAALYVSPFVVIGLANVLLLLWWGIDPLWGFMILPPILTISILGYIGFKYGFIRNVGEERYGDEDDETNDGTQF